MKTGTKLVSALIFLFLFTVAHSTDPKAVHGVIDLREYADQEKFMINLNGEWEFYWKQMLRPFDFKENTHKPDYYGSVPSYWTGYKGGEIKTEKEGFATYRLTLLLPHGYSQSLGVDLPVFDSSYDIYINDKYLGGNGIPGMSREETIPEYSRNFFRYDPDSDTLSIVINVANFSHRRGGFWLPLNIGTLTDVRKHLSSGWAANWAIITLLLGFSLFYLFFSLIFPKEKTIGYFGIATLGLGLRPLFSTHFLINNLLLISWTWIIRFEYLIIYTIIIGWTWFAQTLYPSKYFRVFAIIISFFFAIASVLTLFLPVSLFSYAIFAVYPSMLALILYVIIQSLAGVLRKNRIDIVYFIAFFLLAAGGINDILVSLGKPVITDGYVLTYVVVLFVFIEAALILYKWVLAYNEKEKLQNELEFMNRNLENLINERTREIKSRNVEIEKQNKMIAIQNIKLSETINIKNKIFSVVAHDLRSPVVSILYMLNLLKEKEYKEKYDTFANASISYAQQVISLLENMLVWGRGQEEMIKYSPARLNLADIVLTNLSIFKEITDKKDIHVNFTQVGSAEAFVDKDLLDIIIRNLLSNAVKYTQRGGRISILLKDKSAGEDCTLLKICDSGIGIPETRQKYLFTSTEMVSTPGTENEKGTGLGLKLCQELILINKGSISVESREGEGTCFSITLPA